MNSHEATTTIHVPALVTRREWTIRALHEAQVLPMLARFAPLHYRAGTPATYARVLGAFDDSTNAPRCVGLLCVSRPTLNAPWRARAWPELFAGLERAALAPKAMAHAANTYVRTISRVIVHPTYRGTGVASALVRTYLDHPLTPCTETLAAMGRMSPLFVRCGMREVVCPRSKRDLRLLGVLRARGLLPLDLVCLTQARESLRSDATLAREVRGWTHASKSTRGRAPRSDQPTPPELLVLACAGLVARPLVFVSP